MRIRVFLGIGFLASLFQSAFAQTQLIVNGGFESASQAPWVLTGSPPGEEIVNGAGAYAGAQFLSMGNAYGAVETVYQTVTLPTNTIAATLSFFYNIISSNPLEDDTLTILITDTNLTTLTNFGTASGITSGGYAQAVLNLAAYTGGQGALSSYAGQTVDVVFSVTTDPTYGIGTSFNIDNVSLVAGTAADIPANDDFANRTLIATVPFNNSVSTVYASKEPGEPNHAGNAGGHSVWWTWTAPAIGTATINTGGSTFDTLVAVYSGDSLGNLTAVSSNNGFANGTGLAAVKFNVTPGTEYQIALDGYNGASGAAALNFNFVLDTKAPSVAFTAPAAGASLSNSTVVVTGTASDNVAVAGVDYRLINAAATNAFQPVTGTNTWTVTITNLIPGPNTVDIRAIDTSSNFSPIVARIFNYRVPAPVGISVIGEGTVTGATNMELLDVGFPYTLTAKASAGFGFAGWTGSIATNKTALSFVMASNLSFTATFLDTQRPTLTITAPTPNQRWSNNVFNVTGRATDNVGVSNVFCRLDGGAWAANTVTANDWLTWSVPFPLARGTNNFQAYSEDAEGNRSQTNSVNIIYIVSDRPRVLVTGSGTLSPNYSNVLLQLGNSFSMTARAGAGFVFSNWTDNLGDVLTNGPTLKFVMASNLVFSANFIPNPFLPAVGTYQGLFYETNGVTRAGSGYFSATVTSGGGLTAAFQQGNTTHSFSGQLSLTGGWSTNGVKSWPGTSLSLQVDLTGGNTISGSVSNVVWAAQLMANRAVYSKTNPAPQAGGYTLVLPGTNSPALPGGNGFGSLNVTTSGGLTFNGVLGDGTTVTRTANVSEQGQWPFYLSLYGGNGSMIGWLTFTNEADRDIDGELYWTKPAAASPATYKAGFTNETEAAGSSYLFKKGIRILSLTNGMVVLDDGGLAPAITNEFTLGTNNLVTGADKLSLTITTSSGQFKGSTTNSGGKTVSFSGAILQKQNAGFGQFTATNLTGAAEVTPQ